ncbi:MAG: hypothetical protein CVU89_15615 [Firmicutes bacterium HGW-Firmicutes-14]|nr:MAG: hypothetical protein CVU89_15615 [Firmicutes bacterium HGW-Firmicutes-14]
MKRMEEFTDKYWVTPYNFLDEVRKDLTPPEKVRVHDVTLRESEQAPFIALKPDEKIRIAKALSNMGAASIEIFPIISEEDFEVTRELVRMDLDAKIICLSRWRREDIDKVLETGAYGVEIEGPINPFFANAVFGYSEDDIVERFTDVVKYAKDNGLFTVALPWDDFKTPLPFLERLYKSVVEIGGADHVGLADTFGHSLPWTTMWVVNQIKKWIPGIPIEVHAHNDFNLATTVMISAVAAGASVVHTAVNAAGERAGNAATEEVAVALELLLGVDTGIKLEKLYPVSRLVEELTKQKLARNKPIVGSNEFTYQSGMVVDMLTKLKKAGREHTFMPFQPELIGREPGYNCILGKGVGRTLVQMKMSEMGMTATREQYAEIAGRVKTESMIWKGEVPLEAFKEIIEDVLSGK